jgi:glycosyltransferase involved in cell wall biosynthesis
MDNLENLTLVIPAKEEANALPIILEELSNYNCKKIIVIRKEDTSTFQVIKNLDCKILFQSKFGYGNAIIEGINKAQSKYVAVFYADGSTDPKYLNQMLNLMKQNDKSIVFGSRYEGTGKSLDDNLITRIGNFFFSAVGNIFFKLNISDILFTYFVAKKEDIDKMELFSDNYNLCVEIPIKAKLMNIAYMTLPCIERKRVADKKKVKAFKVGFEILFFLFKCYTNSNFINQK